MNDGTPSSDPASVIRRLLAAGSGVAIDADLLRGLGPDGSTMAGSLGGLPPARSIPPRRPRVTYPSSLFRN